MLLHNDLRLLIGGTGQILFSIAAAFLAVFILSSAFEGYLIGIGKLSITERLLLLIPGILLVFPNDVWAMAGGGIFLFLLIVMKWMANRRNVLGEELKMQ